VIGSLVPSSDGRANLLSITNLGCNINELYLGTRSNGNSVEFSRRTSSGSETRVFGLPYQVTAATTSATFSPNTHNGELVVRLGKIVSSADAAGERELCSYQVQANPASPHQRVSVNVVQDNSDYYEFLPGPASPYLTTVQVVLSASNLLFKSTYDVLDAGSTITKKVTQTIALPTVPGHDQIEISPHSGGGLSVKIYHRPRANVTQQHVPDTDIHITLV